MYTLLLTICIKQLLRFYAKAFLRVSELFTYYGGIFIIPVIITDSSPVRIYSNLHPTLIWTSAISETNT